MKYSIEQARIISGLTPRQMAKILRVSEKSYLQYEKYEKTFRMDQAYAFSQITKITLEQIKFQSFHK